MYTNENPLTSQEIAHIQAAIEESEREDSLHDSSCPTLIDHSLRCRCEYECAHCGHDCSGECDAPTRNHFDY